MARISCSAHSATCSKASPISFRDSLACFSYWTPDQYRLLAISILARTQARSTPSRKGRKVLAMRLRSRSLRRCSNVVAASAISRLAKLDNPLDWHTGQQSFCEVVMQSQLTHSTAVGIGMDSIGCFIEIG